MFCWHSITLAFFIVMMKCLMHIFTNCSTIACLM